jgi:hypothetical protein
MGHISQQASLLKSTLDIEIERDSCPKMFSQACDFDLNFVHVLPGWEGSAHDGRVLADAQARHRFDTPVGKYW